jgi:hypothetical protein
VLPRKCAITWKACPREPLHFPHLAKSARYGAPGFVVRLGVEDKFVSNPLSLGLLLWNVVGSDLRIQPFDLRRGIEPISVFISVFWDRLAGNRKT